MQLEICFWDQYNSSSLETIQQEKNFFGDLLRLLLMQSETNFLAIILMTQMTPDVSALNLMSTHEQRHAQIFKFSGGGGGHMRV